MAVFRRRRPPRVQHEKPPRSRRGSFLGKVFMLIGILTVLYFFITYVIIPILASMTRTT